MARFTAWSLVATGWFAGSMTLAWGGHEDPKDPASELAMIAKSNYLKNTQAASVAYATKVRKLRQQYVTELEEAREQALKKADLDDAQRILAVQEAVRSLLESREAADGDFHVIAARWGAGAQWADVTTHIREMVRNSSLKVVPQYAKLPDPKYGTNKSLVVVYAILGTVEISIVGHDQMLTLPPR